MVKQCPQTTLVFIQTTLRLSVAALLQRRGKVPKLRQQGGITRLIYVFAVEGGGGGGRGWGLVCCGPAGPGIRPDRPPAPSPDVSPRPCACSTRKTPSHAHAHCPPGDTMGTSGAGCQSCPSVPTCPVDPHPPTPASHRRRRHWLVSAFCGQTTNPKSSKKAPR